MQLVKMEGEHKAQVDSLIAKYAQQHAKSETTRLKSQLATREVNTPIHDDRKYGYLQLHVCITPDSELME